MASTFLRNLATALILYEKIDTTEARAKAVKPFVEHLLATAQDNSLQARREIKRHLFHPNAVKKVFEVIAPNLHQTPRRSGYFQMYRLGRRAGDGAEKVRLIINPKLTEPLKIEKDNNKKPATRKKTYPPIPS